MTKGKKWDKEHSQKGTQAKSLLKSLRSENISAQYADSRSGAAGVPGGGGGPPSQSPLVDVVITRTVQVCQGEVGACCCGHGS